MPLSGSFKMGDWLVRPDMGSLQRAGKTVKIEPRYMDLLVYLSRHQGEVVSADEIHREVWAGMVVGDHAVYQAIARLRKALGDRPDRPVYIETVPKRGYRLLLPLIPVEPEGTTAAAGDPDCAELAARGSGAGPVVPGGKRLWIGLALALALVMAALVMVDLWLRDTGPPSSAWNKLAVLPFQMPDSQSGKDYLAHGLTTDLLNQLGRVRDLEVLGQLSTSRFKEPDPDLREIGRRLAVDLLVLGRVRLDGERIRVDIELVDAGSGEQIWSERLERDAGDIFDLQDEIAQQVIRILGRRYVPDLAPYRQAPGETTLGAYDFYLLGQFYEKDRNRRSLERALEMYRQAIETDPELPGAHRGVASTSLLLTYYGEMSLSQAEEVAVRHLERALELDPESAANYGVMGLARYLQGEYGPAVEMLQRAISISGNYAMAWMWLGMAQEAEGKLRRAIEYFEHALRLEPLSVVVNINLAEALRSAGRREEAIDRLQKIADAGSTSVQYNRVMAELQLEQGQLVAAYRHARRALDLEPDDAMAIARMALVLQDLGQLERRQKLFEQVLDRGLTGKSGALMTLEKVYLRLDPGSRDQVVRMVQRLFPDDRRIAQVRWRRRAAFRGLSATYAGSYDQAVEQLEQVFRGGDYAIVSTDFDLLYCTALAFSQRARGETQAADRILSQCEERLQRARGQGWDSQWTAYAAAQLAALNDRGEEAVGLLGALYDQGFNATGLLQNDPLLQAVRQRPGFRALVDGMTRRAAAAWAKIGNAGVAGEPGPAAAGR